MGGVVDNCRGCEDLSFFTWMIWTLGIVLMALLVNWLVKQKKNRNEENLDDF